MNKIIHIPIWIILFLLGSANLYGQTSFSLQAPSKVSAGQQFRIAYDLNAQGKDLDVGSFEGFKVLAGPNVSTNSQITMVNGQMTQKVTYSYIFILQALKEGKFTLPEASIVANGETYTSKALSIEVSKGNSAQQNNNNSQSPSNEISGKDLYVKVIPTRGNLYVGEHLNVTLKVYSRYQLVNFSSLTPPDYNGFWKEEIKIGDLKVQNENIDGQVYQTVVLSKAVLIPQRSGKIKIDPAEIGVQMRVQVKQKRQRRSIFDQMFGSYQNIEKKISSPALTIDVKPLPSPKPAGFTGAVGALKYSATIDNQEVVTNDPISLKVSISGNGNLKLIDPPKVKLPPDFELYDPKVSNNVSANANGQSGSKTVEYLMIPRHAGTFEIPAIPFAYFDPKSKSYKSLSAGPFTINVAKGENDNLTLIEPGVVKEDLRVLGSDIRFIKTNDFPLKNKNKYFLGSIPFFLTYIGSLGLFFLAFFFVRKKKEEMADTVGVRNKKAAKVAQNRLKTAKSHLTSGAQTEFYKSLLQALWGYIADKLNMSTGELNKENIRSAMTAKGIGEEMAEKFIGLIDQCEFAQFAPSSGGDSLESIFTKASELITQMENEF